MSAGEHGGGEELRAWQTRAAVEDERGTQCQVINAIIINQVISISGITIRAGIHQHQYHLHHYQDHHHQVICNGGQASDGEQREVAGKNLPLEVLTLNLLEIPLTTKSTLTCFTHQVHLKERMHALEEKNQLSNEVQRMRKSLEDIGNQKVNTITITASIITIISIIIFEHIGNENVKKKNHYCSVKSKSVVETRIEYDLS